MNSVSLKALVRNAMKHRFLIAVQLTGLVVGFGIVLFLLVKISYERSFDTFWNGYQSVYRIALDLKHADGQTIRSAKNFHGSSELLHEEVPGIVAHCNMAPDKITVYFQEKMIQDVDWFWSDTTFFSVFERDFLYRESDHLFGDLHGIVISQSFAQKLFGNENPINKEIRLNEGWKFLIKGVFEDIPANSHLKVDVLGSYQSLSYHMRNFDTRAQVLIENPNFVYTKASPYMGSRWRSAMQTRPYCYIRLAENMPISRVESAVVPALAKVAFPDNLVDSELNFIFQPLASIHLKSNLDGELCPNGSNMQVNFFLLICMVVILVCFVNYLNMAAISSFEERKSNAIQLINGAPKGALFTTLLFKNIILFCLSMLVAVPLSLFFVHKHLPLAPIPTILFIWLALAALLGALFASLIPFVSLLKEPAYFGLKGISHKTGANWSGRKALVVAQFTISIILLISTFGIYKQMRYVMKEKLGFDGGQTVFSYTPMSMTNHPDIPIILETFRNEALALPGVKSFSVSSSVPGRNINRREERVSPPGSDEPFPVQFSVASIDDQFLGAYGLHLLAGENLRQRTNWRSEEVIINRSAASAMNYKNPVEAIGKVFNIGQNSYKVLGVIEDYHHNSLHFPIQPIIYFQNLEWELSVGYYSFQVDAANAELTMQKLEKIWKKLYPIDEFLYFFSNKEFEAQYRSDVAFNQILTFSALMALLISCLGLLSLAIFNTNHRIKEIGIRKVNGAKVSEVLVMLNKDFVKWVVIAFAIAAPLAWYAMHQWLQNFAYKTELSWWLFVVTGMLVLLIALLTVSWQSWRAARRNPVDALRYE